MGGGTHGFLGLVTQLGTYNAITGSKFTLPTNPGQSPNIPPNATGGQINNTIRQFNVEYRRYTETHCADCALKQQLLKAFDKIYIETLKNPHTGCTTVKTLDIIQHLYDNYGRIT